MPRAALSADQVEEFREALSAAATRLFAEKGYDGVTMRALASELGCSPMTPYRYFENKDEIFETVRAGGFDRFADALENARESAPDPLSSLRALCLGYVRFALEEPHAYRIMFELEGGGPPKPEEARSWLVMRDTVEEAVAAGELAGDPDLLAHLYWSQVHGIVALHLAGKLVLGRDLKELIEAFLAHELPGEKR